MKQDGNDTQLQDMIDQNAVEPFLQYIKTCKPLLHADTGREIDSFLAYNRETGGNPNIYHSRVHNVRNYHRFLNTTLDTLQKNEHAKNDPRIGGKPFTLILHSAIDHNGAFHRDPNLDSLVNDSHNFTLMIEGKSTLSAIQSELKPLAKRYGGGKIRQIMIAGHGAPRGIELAADLRQIHDPKDKAHKNDKLEQHEDAIDLDGTQKKKTYQFFAALLKNMEPGAESRILFNACLTNANQIPEDVKLDPSDVEKSQKTILEAIDKNSSLATTLQRMANKQNLNLKSIGSNASFDEALLNDNQGRLDLIDNQSGNDADNMPNADALTASKLEYIKVGKDPEGAMRAVLECWAMPKPQDHNACFEAVKTRAEKGKANLWDEALIRVFYQIIIEKFNDASLIQRAANAVTHISEAKHESYCQVEPIVSHFGVKSLPRISNALQETAEWNSRAYIPVVFLQPWLAHDPSKSSIFLQQLDTKYQTCLPAKKFIDENFLTKHASALLKSSSPSPGQAKLALLLLDKAKNKDAKEYLTKVYEQKKKFDESLLNMADGLLTADELLAALGLKQLETAPKEAEEQRQQIAPTANLTLDADDKHNEAYIEPLVKEAKVLSKTKLYTRPNPTSAIAAAVSAGHHLSVIGKIGPWLAVEHQADQGITTAFLKAVHVKFV